MRVEQHQFKTSEDLAQGELYFALIKKKQPISIKLENKEHGPSTSSWAGSEERELTGLLYRCYTLTKCDNYTFSFPQWPPGDLRFSIL